MKYQFQKGEFQFEAGSKYSVKLLKANGSELRFEFNGMQFLAIVAGDGENIRWVQIDGSDFKLERQARLPVATSGKAIGAYLSPMPARVLRVLVTPGQTVKAGQGLIVISSMKMENTIQADSDGTVSEVYVHEGQNIAAKAELLRIEAVTSESTTLPPSISNTK